MIGLARLTQTDCGRDEYGDLLFEVEYRATRFESMPGIQELQQIPVLNTASFLKTGPPPRSSHLRQNKPTFLFGHWSPKPPASLLSGAISTLPGSSTSIPNFRSWPGSTCRRPSSPTVGCPIKYQLIQLDPAPRPAWPSQFQLPLLLSPPRCRRRNNQPLTQQHAHRFMRGTDLRFR